MKWPAGATVHIDADNYEWGRVCGAATVLEDHGNGRVLVNAKDIRADITIRKCDARRTVRNVKCPHPITSEES